MSRRRTRELFYIHFFRIKCLKSEFGLVAPCWLAARSCMGTRRLKGRDDSRLSIPTSPSDTEPRAPQAGQAGLPRPPHPRSQAGPLTPMRLLLLCHPAKEARCPVFQVGGPRLRAVKLPPRGGLTGCHTGARVSRPSAVGSVTVRLDRAHGTWPRPRALCG